MASPLETALELVDEIRKINQQEEDKIPMSDSFLREMASVLLKETGELRNILDKLKEAKYIFVIKVVTPEHQRDNKNVDFGVDAYIYADAKIVGDLKSFSDKKLEKAYESTFYKKKSPFQITRELFPKIKQYNNTPLGRFINISVMLEEFQRLMVTHEKDYEDQKRRNKLDQLMADSAPIGPSLGKDIPDEYEISPSSFSKQTVSRQRAVDHPHAQELPIDTASPWAKLSGKFSVEFLVRIHLRKYEFDTVKKLILTGKITQFNDFKFIRDSLNKMEGNIELDPLLKNFQNEITDLRRLAQKKMNILKGITHSGSNASD
ncbi:hypothetical protein CH373_04415 [Leptospira perolatii]|uniref:Uncharacterized protein n=1 Tax=Leptospira perolatii TaxID=2023191 RepID=A0A2M9ZQ19_9LEPT|nr:hypothetical protein [Leptospira perolatii]PJZ68241.1 hypothetical protein CH360_17140 [Leptospira perolatii]PJZ74166.1 hypothetical protein CH373_04415 [Leptospira perolatii]